MHYPVIRSSSADSDVGLGNGAGAAVGGVVVEMLGVVLDVPAQALGWWGHQPLHTCRRRKVVAQKASSLGSC